MKFVKKIESLHINFEKLYVIAGVEKKSFLFYKIFEILVGPFKNQKIECNSL